MSGSSPLTNENQSRFSREPCMKYYFGKSFYVITIFMLLVSACGRQNEVTSNFANTPINVAPSETIPVKTNTLIPYATCTPPQNLTIPATIITIPTEITISQTHPLTVNAYILPIEPGNLINTTLRSGYSLGDYFIWNDDSRLFYYMLSYPASPNNSIRYSGWAAYDLTTKRSITTTSPITYYPSVWLNLGVDPQILGIYSPIDPELRGFISPNGKYVLYSILYGSDAQNPYGRTEIWLSTIDGSSKKRLIEIGNRLFLGGAQWLSDETSVFFSVLLEYSSDLYVADTKTGNVQTLEKYLGIDPEMIYDWALSPNGSTIAIGLQDLLAIIDLKSRRIDQIGEVASRLQWSQDSQRIYYWPSGPDFDMCWSETAKDLRVYNIDTRELSTLVNASLFESNAQRLDFSQYCAAVFCITG